MINVNEGDTLLGVAPRCYVEADCGSRGSYRLQHGGDDPGDGESVLLKRM